MRDCGCTILYKIDGVIPNAKFSGPWIEYCPLHGAAPELLRALCGIIEIGKRDLRNPKYDGYFDSAEIAVAEARGGQL